jgi:hypothetical protein
MLAIVGVASAIARDMRTASTVGARLGGVGGMRDGHKNGAIAGTAIDTVRRCR